MSIPKNIKRADIDKAIKEITFSDIPKERHSYNYFLIAAGKRLPPKYVIGEANKFANNEVLSSDSFNAVEAVAFLKKLKYEIEESNKMVNLKLYDIHGKSTIENYRTLITPDDKYFYWDSKRFTHNEIGDIVFWVNRTERVVLYTKIDSIQVKPSFSDGRNLINDLGYNVSAAAQDASQFEMFYRFKIIEKVPISDDWNYSNIVPFNGQTMAIILYDPKVKDTEKKIEKIEDLKVIFSENEEVLEILDSAQSLLLGQNSNDTKAIKERFLQYMRQFHKNDSTSKEYVKMMPKIEKWFVKNNISSKNFKIWKDFGQISIIEERLKNDYQEQWKEKNKNEHNWYGSPWNMWVKFNTESMNKDKNLKKIKVNGFNKKEFISSLVDAGLFFSEMTIVRFLASMLSKPFVILTGLSGSGKTKIAQAFVQWICQDEDQYRIIPVGADWTNREPLLGYPNALNPKEYVKPDSGVLDLILQANNHPELPHFLILDEMNLSHVERYFADFLSVMESKEEIPLYVEGTVDNGVPAKLRITSNLFVIGTVNIDETTNMFSPKVLDRANTIEFRVTDHEMESFLSNIKEINMAELNTKGTGMANSFLRLAANKSFATKDIKDINKTMVRFFGELKKTGAEFGYRSATEILRLINQLTMLDDTLTTNDKLDIAIMQKLLPKLHGSRRKLCPVLVTLGAFCIDGELKIEKDVFEKEDFDFNGTKILYPLSLEKIARMYKGAIDNGFASFAEA